MTNVAMDIYSKFKDVIVYVKFPNGKEGFLKKSDLENLRNQLPEGTFVDE